MLIYTILEANNFDLTLENFDLFSFNLFLNYLKKKPQVYYQ